MAFLVEIERRTAIRQVLPAPIRADRGLPLIPAGQGVTLVVKIGVAFDEGQLTRARLGSIPMRPPSWCRSAVTV